MRIFSQLVLILHFVGLALGMSVSAANIVMLGVMSKAAPGERAVLARFPPAMSRVGQIGLVIMWATGITMVYTRWSGLAGMPWVFHAKLAAVLLLTVLAFYVLPRLERRVRNGDAAAAARMPVVGKVATVCGLAAVILAVLTFD